MTDRDIGALLRELAEMRREHKQDIRDLGDRMFARIAVVESHVEELRRRDHEHDTLLDTGRHEIAGVSQLLETHAAELKAAKGRMMALTALVAAPGGAGLLEIIKRVVDALL